jgi:hypothetical protein
VVEFGEWLCGNVVKAMPHRHIVFSIPKILRRCFLYDRKRLTDLSLCGWESLKAYFTSFAKHKAAVPGAVIAIQIFGDMLGYNPHLHVLISDGCFHESGLLTLAPAIDTQALEHLFRHEVQYAIITGLGKSERTDDTGDAQQIDSHRHASNTRDKPQEASHAGAGAAQGQSGL